MRALVTGVQGFVGRHLAAHLASVGADVMGVDRISGAETGVRSCVADVADVSALVSLLELHRPTHLFHLAGATVAGDGGAAGLFEANLLGTVGVLEAVKRCPCTVIVASSCAVYGASDGRPTSEDAPLAPLTTYGASKAAQEIAADQYRRAYGIPVIISRTFNLVGPGQPASLMASNVARQITEAEAGGDRTVRVGNLSSQRDYLDVRDAVRAYAALAACDQGVFNVCSGVAIEGRRIVELLAAGSRTPVSIETDAGRFRPGDVDIQVGDPSRLVRATGWQPSISLEQSLRDLLAYWREMAPHQRIVTQ